jgi:hypothetical protein
MYFSMYATTYFLCVLSLFPDARLLYITFRLNILFRSEVSTWGVM